MNRKVRAALSTAALTALGASAAARADHPTVDFAAGTGGVIATVPAATLPKGSAGVGLRVQYLRPKRLSDEELQARAGRHILAHAPDDVLVPSIGAAYGITDDLSIGLSLPYVRRAGIRETEHGHAPGGAAINTVVDVGDSAGLGDLTALAKYRFAHDPQRARHAALLFGAKLPTGDTRRTARDGERFETSEQPGSGSVDPLLGFALSRGFGRVSLDASLVYTFATKGAQDTRLGNRASYNLGVSYRIAGADEPHDHGSAAAPHAHYAWDAVLEVNGEWEGRQRIRGVTDPFSGGNVVYLSPGVRWASTRGWAAVLSIGLPVSQNIRLGHAENDYRVIAGLSWAL